MTRPIFAGAPGAPPPASAIKLDPAVRGESDVQASLEAGVPILLSEIGLLATTTAPPGVIYASDTRVYQAGFYKLSGATTVSATNNNTQVWVGFELDAALQPDPWIDTPVGGTLIVGVSTAVVLTGGSHTFAVRLAKSSGTGSSQALRSTLWVERIGPIP